MTVASLHPCAFDAAIARAEAFLVDWLAAGNAAAILTMPCPAPTRATDGALVGYTWSIRLSLALSAWPLGRQRTITIPLPNQITRADAARHGLVAPPEAVAAVEALIAQVASHGVRVAPLPSTSASAGRPPGLAEPSPCSSARAAGYNRSPARAVRRARAARAFMRRPHSMDY